MNINQILPAEVITQILQHLPPSCMSVCKTFYHYFLKEFQDRPLLKDRWHCLPSNFSEQEKIKTIYQDILYDMKQLVSDNELFAQQVPSLPSLKGLDELDSIIECSTFCLLGIEFEKRAIDIEDRETQSFFEGIKKQDYFSQAQEIRKWMKEHPEKLQTIKVLDFDNVIKLPKEIILLPKLKKLNFCSTGLAHLSPATYQLTNLQSIILCCNCLAYLPAQIGLLNKLKLIDLSRNKLTSLPNEINQLTNLQGLSLVNNCLTYLPTQIGLLTKLRSLDLSHNKLTSLPSEINQLTNLKILGLSHNCFIDLPAKINVLTKLKFLNISHNKLTDLPNEINLSKFVKLKALVLSPDQVDNDAENYVEQHFKEFRRIISITNDEESGESSSADSESDTHSSIDSDTDESSGADSDSNTLSSIDSDTDIE